MMSNVLARGADRGRAARSVLLDAPCSGLGVIARDPSIKLQKSVDDITRSSHLQKELILAAIDLINPASSTGGASVLCAADAPSLNRAHAGYLVYSTCSISVEENEEVVNYALRKRHVKVVDSGLTFGVEGFTRFRDKARPPARRSSAAL
jgi:ribosomal RNA methyltransferase Nop2